MRVPYYYLAKYTNADGKVRFAGGLHDGMVLAENADIAINEAKKYLTDYVIKNLVEISVIEVSRIINIERGY